MKVIAFLALALLACCVQSKSVSNSQNRNGQKLDKRGFRLDVDTNSLLQNCNATNSKNTFPDLDYALMGYHILKAYPLAKGHDPGFTHPIFKADYSHGKQTADCKFSIPDGYTIIPDVSCQTAFSSDTIKSSQQLKKSLGVSAKVSGGGWGVSFSASAEYKKESESLDSGNKVFIMSTATCQYYFSSLDMVNPPAFDDSFVEWMTKLNDAESTDDDYFNFISYYGTHFMKTVVFGARYVYEHETDEATSQSLEREGLSVEASLGYSGFGVNVGASFGYSQAKEQKATNYRKKVKTRTLSVGAPPPQNGDALTWASTVKETPVPFSYEMASIEDLFQPAFMKRYPDIDGQRIGAYFKYLRVRYREVIYQKAIKQGEVCRVYNSAFELSSSRCFKSNSSSSSNQEHSSITSFKECYIFCLTMPDCVAMSYSSSSRKCMTVTNPSDHTNILSLVSGISWCTTKVFPFRLAAKVRSYSESSFVGVLQARDSYVPGTNYYSRPKMASLSDCTESCVADDMCVAAEFYPSYENCFKYNEAQMDTIENGFTSSQNATVIFVKKC